MLFAVRIATQQWIAEVVCCSGLRRLFRSVYITTTLFKYNKIITIKLTRLMNKVLKYDIIKAKH